MAGDERPVGMRARRYRPAAQISGRAIASATAWGALIGLWAAAAAHAMSRFFVPIEIALPAAVGAAVGGAVAMTVRRLRLSRRRPAMAVAAGAAALALAVELVLDFRAARADRAEQLERVLEVRERAGLATRAELDQEREDWLEGWTLLRYARARIGLDDTGTFTGTPPVLGRTGTLALSVLELLVAVLIAAAWAGHAAGQPACAVCGAWREERALGSAAHGVAGGVVKRLLVGNAAGAAGLLRAPDTREEVLFSLFTCPAGHDRDGGVLRIGEVFWTRRRRLALKRVADLEMSGEALAPITAALAACRDE